MELDANKYIDLLIEYGPKVVGVLVALLVGWIVAGWLESAVRKSLEKREFDATLTRFFSKLARYLILIGVVLGCLGDSHSFDLPHQRFGSPQFALHCGLARPVDSIEPLLTQPACSLPVLGNDRSAGL